MGCATRAKSGDDLRYNVVQTLREALYDAYLAERGDPVVWVTEGEPGSHWARFPRFHPT
jgi:hypothetical protein